MCPRKSNVIVLSHAENIHAERPVDWLPAANEQSYAEKKVVIGTAIHAERLTAKRCAKHMMTIHVPYWKSRLMSAMYAF